MFVDKQVIIIILIYNLKIKKSVGNGNHWLERIKKYLIFFKSESNDKPLYSKTILGELDDNFSLKFF